HWMASEPRCAIGRAADIATRAERAPSAGNDEHANVIVLPREVDGSDHLLDHVLVVAIHPLGAVDGDFRDAVARVIDDRLEVHPCLLRDDFRMLACGRLFVSHDGNLIALLVPFRRTRACGDALELLPTL